MAKIPLRVYNREIETLIERGQIEEAIAHSKYILRFFPKHIDTYRLLGKAYIESQRYSEAADILQRILSVVPDDFVSQIGMGIIREDEGNLDAAIYHMERAFEIQPSNAAVQDELRRLYGRRDGIEPPKLRLTRGALVRMYARGNLYRQTIAEIRAALAESQDRFDLEVVLARMYYLLGQIVEATDTASRLVNRLPFCMEANKILAETLPGASKPQEAEIYRQRVFALDPYAAYVSPNASTSAQVPDNAVTLDHLDWEPSADSQQPAWARDVGANLEQEAAENVTDWLSQVSPALPALPAVTSLPDNPPVQAEPPVTQTAPFAAPVDEEGPIPDWLKNAGWGESSGPEIETHLAEEPAEAETLPTASDIPDWLKQLEPAQMAAAPVQSDGLEIPDWLSKIEASESTFSSAGARVAETSQPVQELQPAHTLEPAQQNSDEALPDWLKDLQATSQAQSISQETEQPIPDWLNELPAADSTAESEIPAERFASLNLSANDEGLTSQEPETSTIPDWLVGFMEPEAEATVPAPETQAEAEQIPQPEAAVQPLDVEQGQFLPSESEPEAPAGLLEPAVATDNLAPTTNTFNSDDPEMAAAIAWMESLAARQGADQQTLSLSSDQTEIMRPEWVTRDLTGLSEENHPVPEAAPSEIPVEPAPEIAPISSESLTIEPPAWEEEEFVPGESLPIPAVTATEAEASLPVPAESGIDLSANLPAPEPASDGGIDDFDATFAWLESLAANQGATEGTLLTTAQERSADTPDWIAEQSLESAGMTDGSQLLPATSEEIAPALPAAEEISAELQEQPLAPAQPAQSELEPAASAESTPPVMETSFSWQQEEEASAVIPEIKEEQRPGWLSSLLTKKDELYTRPLSEDELHAATQPAAARLPEAPAAQAEAAVELQAGTASAETRPAEERAAQAETPELIGWVDEAEQQPVAEIQKAEPVLLPPEEAMPELPSWLVDTEPSEQNVTGAVPSSDVEPLPAWLQDFDTQSEPQAVRASDESLSVTTWLSQKNLPEFEEKQAEPQKAARVEIPPAPIMPVIIPEKTAVPAEVSKPVQPVVPITPQKPASDMQPVQPPAGSIPPLLVAAQGAVRNGQPEIAADLFSQVVNQGQSIPEVIASLQDALYRYPVDVSLWQTLGDAYFRNNQVQEALNSYTKAEELLK